MAPLFYTQNGLPPEMDNNRGYEWTPEGRMTIPANDSTCNLHLNREPRFYAAIGYDKGVYEYNSWTEHTLNLKRGKNAGDIYSQGLRVPGEVSPSESQIATAIANQDRSETGYVPKKMINPRGVSTNSAFTPQAFVFPLMRLADLYLMYAEACAEATNSLDATAQGYIREIHNRAGLDGDNFYYKNYSGAQLIEAVRRERMIEMIFESSWHYDLRRWEMAEKWHKGQLWGNTGFDESNGMWGLNILGVDDESFYKETSVNRANGASKYVFDKRMYLMPIYYDHINKNSKLVQNPGY